MYRKWSTFVLLALATPTLALAQSTGKLQGRVFERGDDAGLPGVTVTIEGTQLGAVTDVDGNYTILGIPVGRYNIRAELAGYNPSLVRNLVISSNSTTTQDFTLTTGPVTEEIEVVYTKPLIQNDAITTGRSIQADQIENLPVRGVNAVAATQAGVVDNGSGALNVRGGRTEEVSYYVDGVRVVGNLGVPQQAIQEQELLLGAIPARFGDAMSGVINITTKSGLSDRYFGSAEAITSQFLDPYGYNLGSFSVGGPIVRNRATFFVSTEGTWREDADPYRGDVLRLPDATYAALQANPQGFFATNAQGERVFVDLPNDLPSGTTYRQLIQRLTSDGKLTGLTAPSQIGFVPINRAETYVRTDFESASSKRQPTQNVSLAGNVTVRPFGTMNMRFGGNLGRSAGNSYNYTRSLYNDDRWSESERSSWRVFTDIRQSFNRNRGFYQLNLSFSDDQGASWAKGFGSDIRNTLFYGDVDGLAANGSQTMAYNINDVARRYYTYRDSVFTPQFVDGSLPGTAYAIFALPGAAPLGYSQFHNQQSRFTGTVTNQIGVHQLEAGAEYEQLTLRAYNTGGTRYARYFKDGSVEAGAANGVDKYEDLPFEVVQLNIGSYYGYDYLGLNEVNDSNLDRYGFNVKDTLSNGNIRPWKPVYYAGYIQDKIEYRDLVIQVGFRADVFNANTQVLLDPYALTPIVRVGDLSGSSVPSNIGSDFAVYFRDGAATRQSNGTYTGTVLGYRDLNGVYYTPDGTRTTQVQLVRAGGRPQVEDKVAPQSSIFRDSDTEVTIMPRVGVSFPVTNEALFFASYNVTSQRPSEAAFFPVELYSRIPGRVNNPNLKPEKTTQYEIGFRQRLGESAALQLSGFYRTQTNKIGIRSMQNVYPTSVSYASYYNIDFTTTKGATIEFDLRRTQGLAVNANYTLSFAQGTGSDANTAGTIAWRGNYYPDFLTASDFDRRHSLNVNLDYRLGAGEGPMIGGRHLFENFGINLLGVAQSGLPYTRLTAPTEFPVTASFTENVTGQLNGAYTPWTNRLDMRIDRNFKVGQRVGLNLFLNVQNVLNSRNVLGVYRNTGLANTDSFLDGTAGQQAVNSSVSPASYVFHYNYATASPLGLGSSFTGARAIGAPRQTRLGLRLTF